MSYRFTRNNKRLPPGSLYTNGPMPAEVEDQATELARAFKRVPEPSIWKKTFGGVERHYEEQARAIVEVESQRRGYTDVDKEVIASTAKLAGPLFKPLRQALRGS